MRFGICFNVDYHPQVHGSPRDFYLWMIEQCVLLEELGFDAAWFSEHHSGPYSFGNPALMIAAAAMRTTTLKLGTGVSLLPLHHPVALSEEYAMLDQLTAGRLEYGIGRGYMMHEYPWLGIDAGESAARYRESIDFIRQAWATDDRMRFAGEFYTIDGYKPFPPVWQKPGPRLYSSALSPDSFAYSGSLGLDLGVPLFVPRILNGLDDHITAYEQGLEQSGHVRGDREVMGITQMFCTPNEAEAVEEGARYASNYFRFFSQLIIDGSGPSPASESMSKVDPRELNRNNQTLFGTPAMLVEKIERMRRGWRIDYLQLEVAQGGCDPAQVEDVLRLFAREVIPHFRASSGPRPAVTAA